MAATFAELGIPFPLFDAPSDDSDYTGNGYCCVCGAQSAPCFRLGIGDAVMTPCPACSAENGLLVGDRADVECRTCSAAITFPTSIATKKEPKACYKCVRAGRVALAKSTEFGTVLWKQLFSGVTGGVPGLRQDQFESSMNLKQLEQRVDELERQIAELRES